MPRYLKRTRAQEGCVQYDLHVSTQRPGHFLFHENWISRGVLDRHLATLLRERLPSVWPELAEGGPPSATFERTA